MKKSRALTFKKGDQVVYLEDSYGNVRVTPGVVTLVRQAMEIKRWDSSHVTLPVVYVRFTSQWANTYTNKFCDEYGSFQQNPYPLWKLRHLTNGEMPGLKKRAKQASKLHQVYGEKVKKIQIEVEQEARDWRYREEEKRKSVLPHNGQYLRRVIARLGFKQPKSN